jgi:hypothetical protein
MTAIQFMHANDSDGPFAPSPEPVSYVVKLVAEFDDGSVRHGSGFVVPGADCASFIFTSRHLLVQGKARASRVLVRTSKGHRFLAASCAFFDRQPHDDCAVVHTFFDLNLGEVAALGEPPSPRFEATIRGYPARRNSEVKPRTTAELLKDRIGYAGSPSHNSGLAGGPVLDDGKIVGMHIERGTALRLRFEGRLNTLMQEAFDAVRG